MRSPPSAARSRTRGQRTATGPMPVIISRSGRCPWRTSRRWPSSVSLSAWPPRKPATSASTACANSARAPSRNTSVNGSENIPGWDSLMILSWVTAYHSFSGEVEASNTPTIRRLTPSRRHQLPRITRLRQLSVVNLFVVPKHFFVQEIIERRKPLAATARRAGWIGSNILLNQIPQSGKIYIVRDGQIEPKDSVLSQWTKTLFLRDQGQEARGWLIEVMKCVDAIGKKEFQIEDVYAYEDRLGRIYPGNRNVKPKIRQQLQ